MYKHQKKLSKIITYFLSLCILCTTVFSFTGKTVKADVVTDNLQVCVGYYGMDLSEYVVLSDSFWGDLEASLPTYEDSFSFFQGGNVPTEYTAVVDAARGFSVADLLGMANVYYGDIQNILFYVADAQGIWTAFDRDALFQTRYYFNDLAGHRTVHYGEKEEQVQVGEQDIIEQQPVLDEETGEPVLDEETGEPVMQDVVVGTEPIYETRTVVDPTVILGYSFDDAWSDYCSVEPMLAYEDNWASFSQEFEHIGPDYSYMNAGCRFRLLFGQTEPTESMTRESAKYICKVYITLNGKPVIGDMPEQIDGTLGSHQVTIPVKDVYNSGMRDALSQYMSLNSTNEGVLRVDNIEYNPADGYSDVANVTVSYTILAEGNASLSASIGGQALTNSAGQDLSEITSVEAGGEAPPVDPGGDGSDDENNKDDPQNDDPHNNDPQNDNPQNDPDNTGQNGNSNNGQNTNQGSSPNGSNQGNAQNNNTDGNSQNSNTQSSNGVAAGNQNTLNNNSDVSGDETTLNNDDAVLEEALSNPEDANTQELFEEASAAEIADGSALALSDIKPLAYALTGNAAQQLSGVISPVNPEVKAEQSVTQVQIEDNTDEKIDEQRKILLFTGLGVLVVCGIGALYEFITFRIRLKRKLLID